MLCLSLSFAKIPIDSIDDSHLPLELFRLANSDEPALNSLAKHRSPTRDLQLFEHALYMRLHRALGYANAVANFLVAFPFRD